MKKSELIIIDLQSGIQKLVKHPEPYSFETVVENNKLLMAAFGQAELPIYMVRVEPKVLPKFLKKQLVGEMLLVEESKKYDTVRDLLKFGPSAFTQSDYGLEGELKSLGIDHVVITGVSTDNGVFHTAKDAKNLGFEITIIDDGCSAKAVENHNEAIKKMKEISLKIMRTNDFLSKNNGPSPKLVVDHLNFPIR